MPVWDSFCKGTVVELGSARKLNSELPVRVPLHDPVLKPEPTVLRYAAIAGVTPLQSQDWLAPGNVTLTATVSGGHVRCFPADSSHARPDRKRQEGF